MPKRVIVPVVALVMLVGTGLHLVARGSTSRVPIPPPAN
jgi:hypothetical protein